MLTRCGCATCEKVYGEAARNHGALFVKLASRNKFGDFDIDDTKSIPRSDDGLVVVTLLDVGTAPAPVPVYQLPAPDGGHKEREPGDAEQPSVQRLNAVPTDAADRCVVLLQMPNRRLGVEVVVE